MQEQILFSPPVDFAEGEGFEQLAFGGALEGAEQFDRETISWMPSLRSADQINNVAKPLADARGRDMVRNDGYAQGASALHKDNIVGSQYRLNAKPNWRVLGVTEDWAEQFQVAVEARFTAIAESEECWFDAARRNTFTGMIRLAIGSFVLSGEVVGTAEWLRSTLRPCKTAIQMIAPERLSNPHGVSDNKYLRRGVKRDDNGAPVSYFFRATYPTEVYDVNAFVWKEVQARKPWGRRQVIHILEQMLPDQSRGISDMVAALKQMRMTKKYQEVALQNAVINATYAAAIESELPSGDVFTAIGANDPNQPMQKTIQNYLGAYMTTMGAYVDSSKNIAIDGAKIPHLFPGTKLNLQPVGTPGGMGGHFEESLLRHIAAALGLSYEQFSRDYTKTNYSSARASMNETFKFMQSRKKNVADRLATMIYTLWLEEEINNGNVPLPPGKTAAWFYEPLVKDALCQCAWIGASRGQVDELKETQSAILRIDAGISTYEEECGRLGKDFRDVFEQRAREDKMIKDKGLVFTRSTVRPNGQSGLPSDIPEDGTGGGTGEPGMSQGDGGGDAGNSTSTNDGGFNQ